MVEGIGKQLRLTREQKAPSANTLANMGNTSSSTIWYSLSFIESCQNIRRGDTVWQVRHSYAYGSSKDHRLF